MRSALASRDDSVQGKKSLSCERPLRHVSCGTYQRLHYSFFSQRHGFVRSSRHAQHRGHQRRSLHSAQVVRAAPPLRHGAPPPSSAGPRRPGSIRLSFWSLRLPLPPQVCLARIRALTPSHRLSPCSSAALQLTASSRRRTRRACRSTSAMSTVSASAAPSVRELFLSPARSSRLCDFGC